MKRYVSIIFHLRTQARNKYNLILTRDYGYDNIVDALKKRKPEVNRNESESSLPILEHLKELRKRIIVSLLAILAATVISFFLYDQQ